MKSVEVISEELFRVIFGLTQRWPFLEYRKADLRDLEQRVSRLATDLAMARESLKEAKSRSDRLIRAKKEKLEDYRRSVGTAKKRIKELENALRQERSDLRRMTEVLRAVKLSRKHVKSNFVTFTDRFVALAQSRASAGREDLTAPNFPVIAGKIAGMPVIMPDHSRRDSLERRVRAGGLPWADIYLRHLMTGRGAFLDIGANIGLTSLPHALLRDFSKVIAVEPEARNFDCLTYNVAVNGFEAEMICWQAALGAESGTVELDVSQSSGHHFIRAQGLNDAKPGTTREVPVLSLDRLLEQASLEPDEISLVKCDTQGSERLILAGAEGLLARRRAVWHMEFWPSGLVRAGSSASELGHVMESHFSYFIDTRAKCIELKPVSRIQSDVVANLGSKAYTDLMLFP